MISIYETISKPIINLNNNNIIGNILNANFKGNKLVGFSFFNEEDDEFYLPISSVSTINDVVILKTKNRIKPLEETTRNYLGMNIYSQKGEFIAMVSDILVDDKTFVIEKALSENKTDLDITLLSKIKIISPLKKAQAKPKQIKKNIVKTFETKQENTNNLQAIPNKVISNYRFLIGRKTSQPIYDKKGTLIVSAFETLDEEAIIRAWQHDKIWDIMK